MAGSVRVESGGLGFTVRAQAERIAVELPDVATLKTLLSGAGDIGQLRFIAGLLERYDMDVVIQLKGETIATLGRGAEPGAFENMFALGAVDVKKRQLIKALFKRRD